MPTLNLVTQSEQDADNRAANTSRMINCYLEPVGQKMVIKSVLGMTDFATVPTVFPRAMIEVGDLIYLVQGGALYSIDADGTVTTLASIPDSDETSISSNDGNITIAADGRYFVWDGLQLSEPTGGVFEGAGSVSFFGSLTVLTEPNGQQIQWTEIYDPKTFDALDFAPSANVYDDVCLRTMPIGGSLWVFKTESIERWFNNAGALAPVAGGAIEYGLLSYNLLAKTPNGAFFVSSEGKVILMSGGFAPISTRAVETAIENSDPTHCYFYQDEGHDFCVIRFSDRPAFVYDISAQRWHERAEGDTFDPWSATASVKLNGKWYVAATRGDIYALERTNADASGHLVRQITSSTLQMEGNRFRVSRVEIQGRVGYSNLGRDAQLMLETSRDRGQTWSAPKARSMGGIGEFWKRMVYRALGQFRHMTVRVSCSDPAELTIENEVFVDVS